MITGRLPPRPDRARRVVLPPDHRLSRRWEAVIQRCLAFRPEDRFKEVRDVVFALRPRTIFKKAWSVGAMVTLTAMVVGVVLLITGGDRSTRVERIGQLTPGTDL